MANGALYSQYRAQAGGLFQVGTFGTVVVQKGFLDLSIRALRTFGTQIFITPGNQGFISQCEDQRALCLFPITEMQTFRQPQASLLIFTDSHRPLPE